MFGALPARKDMSPAPKHGSPALVESAFPRVQGLRADFMAFWRMGAWVLVC